MHLKLQVKIFEIRGELTATWWAAAVAMVTIVLLTIFGNIAVLLALKRASQIPGHYPLASLAIADLLVGTCVLPLATLRELFVFHLDSTVCAYWNTLDVLCCTASILSLCILGWERWCGITSPLTRSWRAKRAKILAFLVWPVAFTIALPTAFVPSPRHYNGEEWSKACSVNTNVIYVFISIIFSFYIPATVMAYLYWRILMALSIPPPIRAHRGRSPVKVRQQAQQTPPNSSGINPKSDMKTTPSGAVSMSTPQRTENNKHHSRHYSRYLSPKGFHLAVPKLPSILRNVPSPLKSTNSEDGILPRQRRATRTIVRLMALFLICWTPFFIMLPLDSLCDCVWDHVWPLATWLGYANSAFNPLVYAVALPSVRRALHSLTSSSSGRVTEIPMTPNIRRGK